MMIVRFHNHHIGYLVNIQNIPMFLFAHEISVMFVHISMCHFFHRSHEILDSPVIFHILKMDTADFTELGKWVCLKIGYIPNYSHLIGIMIINHWVQGYTIFRHTQMNANEQRRLNVALILAVEVLLSFIAGSLTGSFAEVMTNPPDQAGSRVNVDF